MQLPGLNGREILAEFRSQKETCDIPVLLVSAGIMTYKKEEMLAMGATGYLPKPFEAAKLLETLDGHLLKRLPMTSVG